MFTVIQEYLRLVPLAHKTQNHRAEFFLALKSILLSSRRWSAEEPKKMVRNFGRAPAGARADAEPRRSLMHTSVKNH